MRISTEKIRALGFIESEELQPSIILLSAALLPTLHRYLGSIDFARYQFGQSSDRMAILFMFIAAFVLFGIIPCLIIRYIFNDSLSNYGLRIGNWKQGIRLSVPLIMIISAILLLPASQTSEMRNFYPLNRSVQSLSVEFIELQIFRGLFFYSAWEFFYRGFMLFGLRRFVGDWKAICIQTIPQCLWHIGMPTGEIFSSILGGILFAVLALRTNSILWPFLLHFMIGTTLDLFIVLV
jgi:membrane protease YdiL (CAAX protease family)